MPGPGELWDAVWNAASQKKQQVTAAIASGADSFRQTVRQGLETVGEAEMRQAEANLQAAQQTNAAIGRGLSKAGDILKSGAQAYGEAEMRKAEADQQAAQAAVNTIKATPSAVAGWTKSALNKIDNTIGEGPDATICVPCILGTRSYVKYQAKQFRICSDGKGGQTVQEVQRMPNGDLKVVGTINPNAQGTLFTGNVWNDPTPVDPKAPPIIVSPPSLQHVNGQMVTPTSGLADAMLLQSLTHDECPGKDGKRPPSAPGGVPGGKCCPGCDCVLYTYSEMMGFLPDMAQSGVGKLGIFDGKVGKLQAQMIRDAINRGEHITISAHSRGSILLENGWDDVFDDYRDHYYKDTYNTKDAIEAGEEARRQHDPESSPIGFAEAERQGRDKKAWEMAERQAADKLNQHVTVITAGNAVTPNRLQDGQRFVTRRPGRSVSADWVTWSVGSTKTGIKKTVPVDTQAEREAAQKRVEWLRKTTGDKNVDLDTGLYHTYGHWYVGKVARQHCHPEENQPGKN
jgi:hypothetical protein